MPTTLIEMHCWNAAPNFGDALAPMIVEKYAKRPVEWTQPASARFQGLGSLLNYCISAINKDGNPKNDGRSLV